jgi:hypothetical protein
MNDANSKSENRPFICNDERGLHALRFWLKDRPNFNVVNDLNSKNGKPDIRLGWDTDPEGDWGKWTPAGFIICANEEIRTKAVALCKRN